MGYGGLTIQTIDPNFYKKAIEKSFLIVDKDLQVVPFKLRPVQDMFLKAARGRDIILKSRQQGFSSLILAMFTIDFLMIENVRNVVISHEAGATQRLFDKVKYYIDSISKTFPGVSPVKFKVNTRQEIVNESKNSTFYIGTAGARAFGHGDMISNLHMSEVSRYPNGERTYSALVQAVPQTGRIILETTANGYGNFFYNIWTKNTEPGSTYQTHFFPWYLSPEYKMPVTKGTEFTEEELEIAKTYKLNREQLMWRRFKVEEVNGDIERFNESFPATASEAFIVSGHPVWSPSLLRFYMLQIKQPLVIGNLLGYDRNVTVEKNEKGFLKIYREPKEFHRYVIGADVAEGKTISTEGDTTRTDSSCAQVVDAATLEQVAVLYGKLDPDVFGRQLELLGTLYNNALIAVERNSMGISTLITLRDLYYPNLYYKEQFGLIAEKTTSQLGWQTSGETKSLMIADATRLLREKRPMIYDEETLGEMMSFVRTPSGLAEAAPGAHDDRVMAYLIALEMVGKPQARARGNDIERPGTGDGVFYLNGVAFGKDGMPVNPEDVVSDDYDFSI